MTACFPERIVCLTDEPTEVLYALGEEARIVGISGFTVRPARARQDKLYEIKSPLILQPGPAALTEGLDALHGIIVRWSLQPQAAA